jgi:glyoxylase-like metal-dependent hydrolase (beta-lactamase superfamily II)
MQVQIAPTVRVIKVGTLRLQPTETPGPLTLQCKTALGIGGGSTVTLVSGSRRLLVDTGFDFEEDTSPENRAHNARALLCALQLASLSPEDVNVVFITHWHRDHVGNLWLFPRAQWLVSQPLHARLNDGRFSAVADGEELMPGVHVMLSPGHTPDHASLVVMSTIAGLAARIAVAGDAVLSHSTFAFGRLSLSGERHSDRALALESMKRIAHSADLIVPGHGVPFASFRPDWLASQSP